MLLLLNVLVLLSCGVRGDDAEDARLNFTMLGLKYGQEASEHEVETSDGYLLRLFRLAGDGARPVLLVHGVLDSADGFIVRGNSSLAVSLAREGYDVWAMNFRGNRYARRHRSLDPDADKAFWDFYVHEYGTMDVAANIDYIAQRTTGKVSVVGFSEGTTATFVLGAVRPEYNDKVSVAIALAPICYLHHARQLLADLLKIGPSINRGLRMVGTEEVVGFYSPLKSLAKALCNVRGVGYLLCVLGGVFAASGTDPASFEPEFLPILIGHFPAGTSRKNLNHLVQVGNSKRFAAYDYGPNRNALVYGSAEAPAYDLRAVRMRIALLVGDNDIVSTREDVALLRRQLPNVVEYRRMPYPAFNHIDFIWGTTTHSIVLPQLLDILHKYNLT